MSCNSFSSLAFSLSKTYKEKWTKRRGEVESTFTGNETSYEINSKIRELEFAKNELQSKKNGIKSAAKQLLNEEMNALEEKQQEIKHKIYTLQKDKQYDKAHIEEVNLKILKTEDEKNILSEKYLSVQAEKPTFKFIYSTSYNTISMQVG